MTTWKNDGIVLTKDFQLKNFAVAMRFVNQVAELAEAANHHPDIFIHGYKNVRLSLTTHSAGRVTEKDEQLAKHIDLIAQQEYNTRMQHINFQSI